MPDDNEEPTVLQLAPRSGSVVRSLTRLEVFFSEVVDGVDAADLLVNHQPATGLLFGGLGHFVFEFPQPATGLVEVAWAPQHGIRDRASSPHAFAGGNWTYTLDPNAILGGLMITEFMAENQNSLRDEDGETSDWIELYNASGTLQTLDGWTLTDDVSSLAKWRFPAGVQLLPDHYLVVFASGKARATNGAPLHTNFRLAAAGEYLALVDPLGRPASAFAPIFPPQSADISYGRDAGDPGLLQYFPLATPGIRNTSGGPGFAPPVEVSHDSRAFLTSEPFEVTLRAPLAGAAIYYSLGTNLPNTASFLYTNALRLTNSTMLRARAFAPGLLPGPMVSRSYVALSPELASFSSDLPVVVLHNFGQGPVLVTKEDQHVVMQAFLPGSRRTALTNAPAHAERGRFHVRGSTTAVTSTLGKSSFFLELQDELGADKNVPLLGLPEESDWVLYAANALDVACFQNPLGHELAREMGLSASHTRFFELFLKDDSGVPGPLTAADYYGLFVLEEKIKRSPNRVAIDPLEPEQRQQPQISGGYIFSIDRSNGEPPLDAGGVVLNWVEPSGVEMTNQLRAAQLEYIRGYFDDFAAALHGPNWTNTALGYGAYIDVPSWIDYHLHSVVTFNVDALRLSTYLHKPRGQRLKFGPVWDFDRSQGSTDTRDFNPLLWRSTVLDLGADHFNEPPWWGRLFQAPDFWQAWVDRYQELREGALATNNIFTWIDRFAAEVQEAQARNQSRWNVLPRAGLVASGGFSYHFGDTVAYDNEVRFKKHWYDQRLRFIDNQLLARPQFTSPDGLVEVGHPLAVLPADEPGTLLLCTLDGTDPRLPGGAISPAARSTLGPLLLAITNNVRLMARSFNPNHRNLTGPNNPPISTPWSGPVSATFYTHVPSLRITELMYHPRPAAAGGVHPDEDYEFIEVKNVGTAPLALRGFHLGGGVGFEFPSATLAPGEYAVLVADPEAFQSRYPAGPRVLGVYQGQLNNGGERLTLTGAALEPILDFRYDPDWYPITDGFGFSLVHVDPQRPTDSWNEPSSWRPSALPDAFPAADDPVRSPFPKVVINEVRTATPDAIELLNLSPATANIGDWFLTDDFRNPKKFQIPAGTLLASGELKVFDETELAPFFGLTADGEELYLFSADEDTLTGYVHGFDFGPVEPGLTFGRHVTRTGDEQFPEQSRPSLGATNAGPRIGPVVMTEIHYHPPDEVIGTNHVDNVQDEFIELFNLSDAVVPLYDPDVPANTWELTDAVKFTFPPGTSLGPRQLALVVPFAATNVAVVAAFRARFNVPAEVPFYGPFEGKLDNSEERVELRRPRALPPPAPSPAPRVLVERVHYTDEPPWPSAADGMGRSLHRLEPTGFANDALNWAAAAPSPGRLFAAGAGAAPLLLTQPLDATVQVGATNVFAVDVGGPGPFAFQWRRDGQIIPAATNVFLALANIQQAMAGDYDVVVMNPFNCATSRKARLQVERPLRLRQPPLSQTIDAGAPAYFSVFAEGTPPLRYQWRFASTPLAGENKPVLVIPVVTNIHQGAYDVVVTDRYGSISSAAVLLLVKVLPTVLAPSPALRLSVVTNELVTLAAEVHGTFPLWVRWRVFRPVGSQILQDTLLPSPGPLPLQVTQATFFLSFTARSNSEGAYAIIATNAATSQQVAVTNTILTLLADSDGDQLPDDYERQFGLRPDNAADAAGDLDGDHVSNRDEYFAGTDPRDPNSYLRLELVPGRDSLAMALRLGAISNRTYTVQATDRWPPFAWSNVADIVPAATNRVVIVPGLWSATNHFYRVVTPKAQ